MPPRKRACVCCDTALTRFNTPNDAMMQEFENSHLRLCTPSRLLEIERHLIALIEYEETGVGKHMVQQDAKIVGESDHLTAFQVRGFRREIMTYRHQPIGTSRLFRVLRRLMTRWISKTVLFETGIESAVALLCTHQDPNIEKAALALVEKWVDQYPQAERSASFMLHRNDCAMDPKYRAQLEELLEDIIETAQPLGLEKGPSKPTCNTTNMTLHTVGKVAEKPRYAVGTDLLSHVMADEPSRLTDPANISSSKFKFNNNGGLTGDNIIRGLAPICAETLDGAGLSERPDQTNSKNILTKQLPRTNFLEPVYDRLEQETALANPVVHTFEEFLTTAKLYMCSDDRTIELLKHELDESYLGTTSTLELAAATISAKVTLLACSAITQDKIRAKDLEIASIDIDGNAFKKISAARHALIEEKSKLEKTLEKQTKELGAAIGLYKGFESDLLMSLIIPLKRMMDLICIPKDGSRDLVRYISDSRMREKTIQQLKHQLEFATTSAIESKTLVKGLDSKLDAMYADFERAQILNAKLKENMDTERVSLNSKYYKDIETQVEERVQQERMKSVTRLREFEAKAQQYDAVETENFELRIQIKDTTHKLGMQLKAQQDLEERHERLKRREEGTQQGYDQMRQEKIQAECQAHTLEASLRNLQAEFDNKHQNHTAIGEIERTAGSRSQTPPSITIVTHTKQLSEADRLHMIAQRWQNDLRLAEIEQNKAEDALVDTETQITLASRQLRELSAPKSRLKRHTSSLASLKTSGSIGETSAMSRLTVRSESPVVSVSSSLVPNRNPWGRVDEQLHGSNRTAQQVSTIFILVEHSYLWRDLTRYKQVNDQTFPPLVPLLQPARGASGPIWPVKSLRLT